MNFIDGERKL